MLKKILYISQSPESQWKSVLTQAVCSLGELDVIAGNADFECLEQNPYDLLILDVETNLKPEVLKVKLECGNPKAKILVVSALPSTRQAAQALRGGADDFITRWEEPARLGQFIGKLLDLPEYN
jgi:DNA-binding response OmpR family regulator